MTDTVCGNIVVKNGKGQITWPRNIKSLCQAALTKKQGAEE